jgi:hypothetical protein
MLKSNPYNIIIKLIKKLNVGFVKSIIWGKYSLAKTTPAAMILKIIIYTVKFSVLI